MPEVMAFLVFIVCRIPLPLSAMLVLIVDLGTELGPALSYYAEPPEGDLMLLGPRKVLTTAERAAASSPSPQHQQQQDQADNPEQAIIQSTTNSAIVSWWQRIRAALKRDETGEVLVDNELLLWCYLQGGMIETAGCFGAYLAVLAWEQVPLGTLYRSATSYFHAGAPDLLLTNNHYVQIERYSILLCRLNLFCNFIACLFFGCV